MAKQWRIVIVVASLIVLLLVATFSVKVPGLKLKHKEKRKSTFSRSGSSNATEIPKNKKSKNNSALESITVDANSNCWKTEETRLIGQCVQCSNYEKRTIVGCYQTGNIQLIYCTSSEVKAYISCPYVKWWEEKKFWIFEGCMLVILFFSSFMVWYRQRQLDNVFHQKLHKQVQPNTI